MSKWHVTKVIYETKTNEISEEKVSEHDSYETSQAVFIEKSALKEPVYLWLDINGQKRTLAKSTAFFRECSKLAA
jgi:hypothetical protein